MECRLLIFDLRREDPNVDNQNSRFGDRNSVPGNNLTKQTRIFCHGDRNHPRKSLKIRIVVANSLSISVASVEYP
jgi:hypothetical protein